MQQTVCVVGLGYVGLPLAILASKVGFKVFGVDIDSSKIAQIYKGESPTEDISSSEIISATNFNNFEATVDFSVVNQSNVVVLCLPTPVNSERKPDLTYLLNAIDSMTIYLKKDTLIIVESTISPGTTRNVIIPALLSKSKLVQSDLYFSYSPERIDPTNKIWTLANTPKLVSGFTDESKQKAIDFYKFFIPNIISCDSLEIAETAKLLENSFRLINISFINEISMYCNKINIDINKVISAAATKPYGFMPFYPSIGVGGHCIPVDPIYLAEAAKLVGSPSHFISLADQINQIIPSYFIGRAEEKLNGLKDRKIIVIGVAYKPNISDVRESPVKSLITGLKQRGAIVSWHDDLVKEWDGSKSVELSDNFDLAILATPHDYLDLTKLRSVPILNTRSSI